MEKITSLGSHFPCPSTHELQSTMRPLEIKGEDYLHIIRGKPDEILRGPAFRLVNTRSERIVAAREKYARIKAKSHATKLSSSETQELKQLSLLLIDGNGQDLRE